MLSVSLIMGCGKKDADKAAGDKPSTTAAPAAGAPPAAAKPTAAPKLLTAADVPAECKPFMDALETLSTCEKISAAERQSMIDSNQKMLKAMVDLGDTKASIDGCTQGLPALQQAIKTAGC